MSPTVGEQLRKAREDRGLSLEQASRETHIRLQFLQAIENNHLHDLPSLAQARGFIRLYASFLGLSVSDLLGQLDAVNNESVNPEPTKTIPSTSRTDPQKKAQSPKIPKQTEKLEESFEEFEDFSYLTLYVQIGAQLRERRESLALSLEDVALHTHLKSSILSLLENGKIDELPSPVQARGMLSNYAEFLNLDSDNLLLQFAEALQQKRRSNLVAKEVANTTQTSRQQRKIPSPANSNRFLQTLGRLWQSLNHWLEPVSTRLQPVFSSIGKGFNALFIRIRSVKLPKSIRKYLTTDLLMGAFLILILFAFIFWAAIQFINWNTSNSLSSTLTPTVMTATSTFVPGTGNVNPTSALFQTVPPIVISETAIVSTTTPVPGSNLPLQLYVIMNQRAFVNIKADGVDKFLGRALPGNVYQYGAYTSLELISGNAAALKVLFNQRDLGTLGDFGQPVDLVFSALGIMTPTPSVTFTPTPTQVPSKTASRTPTVPTPTVTPLVP